MSGQREFDVVIVAEQKGGYSVLVSELPRAEQSRPPPAQIQQNPENPKIRGFVEADEGIRTLDLRHGKATL